MAAGEVPADWRNQRIAVEAEFMPSALLPELRFLDVEALSTRRELRTELATLLAYYGYQDLDVPTVRGDDRRITRWIAKWAFEQRDTNDLPVFAGIRYLSRLNTDWECWAVFHDVEIKEIARERPPSDYADVFTVLAPYEFGRREDGDLLGEFQQVAIA